MSRFRDHDKFYAYEDQAVNPKEYFKKALSILSSFKIENKEDYRHLDIGCAASDFITFLIQSGFVKATGAFGIDVMDSLLEESVKRNPTSVFHKSDISSPDFSNPFDKPFDSITMLGVHSIFDDFFWLENTYNCLADGGVAVIFGIFNPYPYDVNVKVSKSGKNLFESGWSVVSKQTIYDKADNINCNASFIDFDPDIFIPETDDKLRTWTIDLSSGQSNELPSELNRKRGYINATRIFHDWSFLILKK